MYTYKTGLSTSEHDRFVIDSPQTNLLQSSSWAKIKDSWGNDRLGFYQDGNIVAVASVLIQPLRLRAQNWKISTVLYWSGWAMRAAF